MLTLEDYYYHVFPICFRFGFRSFMFWITHPLRILIVVYQPFELGTITIFSYRESKSNTRKCNMIGYMFSTINGYVFPKLPIVKYY
ncbi:putative equilibrative nucleoside transporter [Arabidopsis thaliana]